MTNDFRPDPDALLAAIQKDTARETRGKLKVFFGMAAGVGKTYAMLESARRAKSEGVDVIVGYVETHKRAETEAMLSGLEVLPRQKLPYKDVKLEEMDLDGILKRHPQLVLVDELAHTNANGTRHPKRWQDVIEILEAGINVYTTVNVQHFESRADAVAQITGVIVHETVPDTVLDMADEIELVDLSPTDLRKRLAEGKVYTSERIQTASNNFFRIGNLTALREMALRVTAEHVDHKLQDYMALKQIAGPWKSGERLMVAVGPSPFSEQLIRWTRRMAYNLEASWLAVFVEAPDVLSADAKERLAHNLALARNLGAEIVTTVGTDITQALLHLARQRNVTQIVIGKPLRHPLQDFLRGGSLVDKLIRASGDIDVYVVTGDKEESNTRPTIIFPRPKVSSNLWQYALAAGIVIAITVADLIIQGLVSWWTYQTVGLTELMAVLLIAVYIGRGPALLAAFISALSWNFLFIEPRFTFDIRQPEDIILFLLYFVIAVFTGNLTARIRTQERQARYNADRTMALYTLAHESATAVNMDDVLKTAVTQIGTVFEAEIAIILLQNGKLSDTPHITSTLMVNEKDASVARWAFENGKPAGRFTDTLPLASATFLPLNTPRRIVGVIGILTRENERLTFEQEVLLETFINQVALTIERELLDEAAEQSDMLRESERLYTTLLNSISHELRTPIAAITGAASSLLDTNAHHSDTARHDLTRNIQGGAERLNRLVANLLDMSRLESGRLSLKREWCDVGEIIGVAVRRLNGGLDDHRLTLDLAADLPLIEVDFTLIEQVIVNLLDNAAAYTPDGTQITIKTHKLPTEVEIAISDNGQGIPVDDLERIFEKFYRVPGTATGGTGLGLSISRGLVEAHGGSLSAEVNSGGGTRFLLRLPARSAPPPVKESTL